VGFAPAVDLAEAATLGPAREGTARALSLIGQALANHVATSEARTGIELPDR
jgi:hypothetical protein